MRATIGNPGVGAIWHPERVDVGLVRYRMSVGQGLAQAARDHQPAILARDVDLALWRAL